VAPPSKLIQRYTYQSLFCLSIFFCEKKYFHSLTNPHQLWFFQVVLQQCGNFPCMQADNTVILMMIDLCYLAILERGYNHQVLGYNALALTQGLSGD